MLHIHSPTDRPLLAVRWQGTTFVDGALPFGLQLLWWTDCYGSSLRGGSSWKSTIWMTSYSWDCWVGQGALSQFREPSNCVKCWECQWPVKSFTFLGMEINTQAGQLRLPGRSWQIYRIQYSHGYSTTNSSAQKPRNQKRPSSLSLKHCTTLSES